MHTSAIILAPSLYFGAPHWGGGGAIAAIPPLYTVLFSVVYTNGMMGFVVWRILKVHDITGYEGALYVLPSWDFASF